LAATVKEKWDENEEEWYFEAIATYKVAKNAAPPRGKIVTFVTYPDFESDKEDAYELFSAIDARGVASVEFYPAEGFTIAAIGDAGDTALTLNLSKIRKRPKNFK